MHLLFRGSGVILSVFLSCVAPGLHGQNEQVSHGRMVTGALPPDLTLRVGDTLLELVPSEVPDAVRATARWWSQLWKFLPMCARYFSAGKELAVVLSDGCCEDSVPRDDHGEGLLVVRGTGEVVGEPVLGRYLPPGAFWLFPAFRFVAPTTPRSEAQEEVESP